MGYDFFFQCHSNETLGNVRVKIANRLRQTTENIQVVAQEKQMSNIVSKCRISCP